MLKTQIGTKYEVVEEVDAGFKDLLKKAGKALLGVTLLSSTAFGMNLKNPKGMVLFTRRF
jgi:hypothetical protein